MTNLFAVAKEKAPKKVEKHEIVERPELENTLERLESLNAKMAELEAERAILDAEIRGAGKDAMIDLYNRTKKFPGTLKMVAGTMSYQFITSDKYKKIDVDRFAELSETYGPEIVEESTVFSFNTAILMKHMQHISDLLMGSTELSQRDKEELLTSETSYNVKKGAIKDLFQFVDGSQVDAIIEDIQPVFSVKSVQRNS